MDQTDRDLAIRTMLGEAKNQGSLGLAGVAHVILNRTASGKYGASPSDVVMQRNAFEPWSTRAKELWAISPSSEAYQRAGRILDASAAGAPDPTGGATHFANVQTVRDRNGGTVGNHGWINPANQTATIGAHTFFAPEGTVTKPPMAFAPTGGPATTGAPAMDAINTATQPAGQPDLNALLLKSLQAHAAGNGTGFDQQAPLKGALGRGLYNLFTGNGFHIGPVGPQALPTPPTPSPLDGVPAAQHAMAGLPQDQGTPAPDAPMPPTKPLDLPSYDAPPTPAPAAPPAAMAAPGLPPGTSNSPLPPPDAPDMSMGGGNPLDQLKNLFGGAGGGGAGGNMAPPAMDPGAMAQGGGMQGLMSLFGGI